ncbi:MAG: helix-turn-helix domain-containing protein [Planctomycetales bacterium]|nr:helix-turn-helix domain-containing protein [Planctomycetales bacterium]
MNRAEPRPGRPIGRQNPGRRPALAERLIRRRLALGLSQESAADALGVARPTWSNWELGVPPRGLYGVVLKAWLRGEWPPRR